LTDVERDWINERQVPLRIGPDPGFAPLEMRGPEGELSGISGEYLKILEEKTGLEFEVIWFETWAESVRQMELGNLDLWTAAVETEKRREYMLFTSPYMKLKAVFVVLQDCCPDNEISFESLRGKSLIVVEGWYHQDLIEQNHPDIELLTVPDLNSGVSLLKGGLADVLLTDTTEITYILNKENFEGLRVSGNAELQDTDLRMACRIEMPVLRSILDKTLASISEEEKKRIFQRWVNLEGDSTDSTVSETLEIPHADPLFWKIFILFFFLLGSILNYKQILKKKIRGKIQLILIILFGFVTIAFGFLAVQPCNSKETTLCIDLTNEEIQWLESLDEPLSLAPDVDFAPIEWIDENGLYRGIAADYMELIESKLGIKFNLLHFKTWDENVLAAKVGEVDIWPAVAPTSERREYMRFTHPHIKLTAALLVNERTADNLTLEMVGDRKIAAVHNYYTYDYIHNNYPEINLVPVFNIEEGIRSLAFGSVDGLFTDLATATYILKEEVISTVKLAQSLDAEYNLAIASRRDQPLLNSILDKAVLSITSEEHEEIMNRWIDRALGNSVDYTLFIRVSVVAFILLLSAYLWNLSLKRRVSLKTKELREAQDKIIEANQYIGSLVDSMPSLLIGLSPAGTIIQWNREAEQSEGIEAREALGMPLEEAVPRLSSHLEKIKNADPKNFRVSSLREGEEVFEDVTVFRLDKEGSKETVVRIDNISEKIRMEHLMIQNEKMLSVGGLAAGVAHELNNPLAGLVQTASVLENRLLKKLETSPNKRAAEKAGTTTEAIRSFMELRDVPRLLDSIDKSGKRMASIIENILSFSRRSDNTADANDINGILDRTLDLAATEYDLEKHYDFKSIAVVKEFDENLPRVFCEKSKIQQVFLNLLRNGAQAMGKAGTVCPRFILRTSFEEKNQMVRIEVEDNGPGMEESVKKRIFEPFFTTKPVGVGTGLGLSISYFIIAENHGGTLEVTSSPGKGCIFVVRLPLVPSPE